MAITVKFKISDDSKYQKIFSLINPNFNEEGGWTIDYSICAVYDDYALVSNYSDDTYERVYYTKSEDDVILGERKKCFVIDVSEEEMSALDDMRKRCGAQLFSEINTKYQELETSIETLNSTIATQQETITTQEATIDTYKKCEVDAEKKNKCNLIETYSKKLDEETLNTIKQNLDTFSLKDLERELAF
jgi:hypothetical protein